MTAPCWDGPVNAACLDQLWTAARPRSQGPPRPALTETKPDYPLSLAIYLSDCRVVVRVCLAPLLEVLVNRLQGVCSRTRAAYSLKAASSNLQP